MPELEVFIMGKKSNISHLRIDKPHDFEYTVILDTANDKKRFIKQCERIVRASLEYRDYINFLKENMNLNQCIFFQGVTSKQTESRRGRVSIEMHHEPFTLYDYVEVVLKKHMDEGIPISALLIADEVLDLHYGNYVGLVPLSKTMHQIIHDSPKLMVPLTMCYGNYSSFLEMYEPYISDEMYEKLERKLDMTSKLDESSFDAIRQSFTYVDVKGYEDIQKQEVAGSNIA